MLDCSVQAEMANFAREAGSGNVSRKQEAEKESA